jgi:hypothetical protein
MYQINNPIFSVRMIFNFMKIELIRFFILISLFLVYTDAIAQTKTWDGSESTDWFDDDNWTPSGVPASTDDVIIPNGTINQANILFPGALAKSLIVQLNASFNINEEGELTINGFRNFGLVTVGFINAGNVNNNGILSIGTLTSVGDYALLNLGSFNNNVGGTISIDSSELFGVYVLTGTFNNFGKITIGSEGSVGSSGIFNLTNFNNSGCGALVHIISDNNIENSGTFTNSGNIIENASGNSSISSNSGIVQNLNGGTFSIGSGSPAITSPGHIWTGCVDTLWSNPSNWHTCTIPTEEDDVTIPPTANQPSINESIAMANSVHVLPDATLYIGLPAAIVIRGFKDFGSFTAAFFNEGTVNNCGELFLWPNSNLGEYGIYNQGSFNNPDGNIQIDSSNVAAIFNNTTGEFTNSSLIFLGSYKPVGQYGIQNLGTFFNNFGGHIQLDNSTIAGIFNEIGSEFTNESTMAFGANMDVGPDAIANQGRFDNRSCDSKIDVVSNSVINNFGGADSTFVNSGCININSSGESTITNNSGFIQNFSIGMINIVEGSGILGIIDTNFMTFSATASGGGTYLWSGGTTPDMATNTFLTQGVYTLTVTSQSGCLAELSLNFFDPNALSCIGEINLSLNENCEAPNLGNALVGPSYHPSIHTFSLFTLSGENVDTSNIKAYIGQKLKYEVMSSFSNNKCWGYLNIEDKNLFGIIPIDTDVYCIEGIHPDRTGNVEGSDCQGPIRSEYRDIVEDRKCTLENDTIQIITRTWLITNNNGYTVIGEQIIYVLAIPSDSIKNPIAYVELSCEDSTTPESIRAKLGVVYAYPFYVSPVTGDSIPIVRGSSCHFVADYADLPIFEEACQPNCKATQKILRTWTVLNWCDGEVRTYQQLIKRKDAEGPEIDVTSPENEYSVNAWGCDVDITLPSAVVKDNCDPDAVVVQVEGPFGVSVVQVNGRWIARAVPSGTHTFTYTASDCCGNLSTAEIRVVVKDRVAPVATAKEFITVSLTKSNDDSIPGVAKLYVSQVDNGSYDNCTKVYMEVRREDDAPACLNDGDLWNHDNSGSTPDVAWNNNRTYNSTLNGLDQTTDLHLQDNPLDTDKGQFVKFCCEDIGEEVKVWLRVWDDANGSGIFGDTIDGMGDNYNETWTMVKVEDKIVPSIECVPYVETSCDRDTGIVTDYNFQNGKTASQIVWENTKGKVPSSLVPTAEGACDNYEFEFYDIGSLSVCNIGTFIRTYRVIGHPTVSCTQTIYVDNEFSRPRLEWPIVLHEWDRCELTEEDVLNNTVRARINDFREFGQEGCFIKGQFPVNCTVDASIIGLCEGENGEDPKLPYTVLETTDNCGNYFNGRPGPISTNGSTPTGLPRFNPNFKDPGCNVLGRKISIEEYNVGEGCKKWIVKFDYINWCCNEKAACRETIYKYEDTVAPEIVTCPSVDTDILDLNCRAQFTLSPEATDEGLCDAGLSWRIRIYPNIANPTAAQINNTSLYREYNTVNGLITGQELRGTNPTFTHPTGLLAGIHGVLYIVRDGCGNVTECRSTIGIWPKAPTPYCVSLSSAVMKNGLVELWAEDFDRGSFQNCPSPAGFRVINDSVRIENDVLFFTFNRAGQAEHPIVSRLHQEHYFRGLGEAVPGTLAQQEAAYNEGKAQKWLPTVERGTRPLLPDGSVNPVSRWDWVITGGSSGQQFGCNAGNTIGVPITVEMRVWDVRLLVPGTAEGSDFCSTRLTLIDNQSGCGEGTLVVLGGTIQTEKVEMMEGVDVTLKSELQEYQQSIKTTRDGKYEFRSLPIGVDYTIEANKTDNYLNGVNTLDLIQIQRHMLGIELLENPYELIAADADGDEAIRVNDIVTLRKLILGITDEIENMPSWRFVDASDRMENGPWPFREVISHGALTETKTENNFIAVKLGDVDGSAAANVAGQQTEPRNIGIKLIAEDRQIKVGEEVVVPITTEQFKEVYGMQWTMKHEGLELIAIDGRAIELKEDNAGRIQANTTTLSWASTNAVSIEQGSEVMRLTFKATKALQLSSTLQITSEVTLAEAYVGSTMERSSIVLEIRSNDLPNVFTVSQNEPNPWKTSTVIRYDLPQAGEVKLTISDVTGRTIRTYNTKGEVGVNELIVTKDQLGVASGIFIYQIESAGQVEQRKMMVVE